MNSFKKVVLSVGLAVGLVIPTAVVASAAPANCPSGYGCAWKDRDYKTAGSTSNNLRFQYGIPDVSAYNGWVSSITSIYNNGNSQTTYWYLRTNYQGTPLALSLKAGKPRLNETNPTYHDSILSMRFN